MNISKQEVLISYLAFEQLHVHSITWPHRTSCWILLQSSL